MPRAFRPAPLAIIAGLVLASTGIPASAQSRSAVAEPGTLPRLVLQITVDQLRGDLPLRSLEQFGAGGFRYLLENGTAYLDAHHPHANTETIVGHTTLATGAYPSAHGMIGNVWFDQALGRTVYNIEDPNYRLLTADAGVDQETEIDPTQRQARSDGRSPAAILSSTFADELAVATSGKAKIFGVSVKDRGAVSMAGHAGKAFWFSKQSGEFVTSTYYYDAYPGWVTGWNAQGLAFEYAGREWALLDAPDTYLFADRDDREGEVDLAGFGSTFPHPWGAADSRYFTTLLTLSPAGDELTLDFAKRLLDAEDLGRDEVTDYLSVSFSSTDYVGHLFGPSSLEAEDNLRRLDRTLADLLAHVDARVGLENTLVVLSSDHGGAEIPAYLSELGVPSGYVDPESWDRTPALARLKDRFGVAEELIVGYDHPYLTLDEDLIRERGLGLREVEEAVAREIMGFEGVAVAVSSEVLRVGAYPDTPVLESVLRNFNPARSGNVFIVFAPGHFINDFDGLTVAATHGSPWRYDTFVPVWFAGWGVPAGVQVNRRVHTTDVAPTLSRMLGIKMPSAAAGVPLVEVLGGR